MWSYFRPLYYYNYYYFFFSRTDLALGHKSVLTCSKIPLGEDKEINSMVTEEDDHVTKRQGAKKSLVCALLVLATMAISLTAGLLFHFYYPREQSEEIL